MFVIVICGCVCCVLRSETAHWRERLGPGSAHCDLGLAVGAQHCPLRSGTCGRGPGQKKRRTRLSVKVSQRSPDRIENTTII